jgi:hypothetical protein
LWPGRPVGQQGAAQWAGRCAAHLFSQCIMAWRSLPWARGSGCQSFSSPWSLPQPSVSPASHTSLIHVVHTVCVCVVVAILDLLVSCFDLHFPNN